ncbi:MAG: ribonuclease P protein component [Candidatus Aegiribacteria sp.]
MKRTLNRGSQFRRVFRTGKAFRGGSFRAVYAKNALGFIRLGFSLSAKSGNAVSRNLMRRRIRSLARGKRVGADIVILPVGGLEGLKWQAVKRDFDELLRRMEDRFSEGADEEK